MARAERVMHLLVGHLEELGAIADTVLLKPAKRRIGSS
jgi:hypothetical protein